MIADQMERKLLTAIPMSPSSLYIAGPMTGIEEFNWPAFDAVQEALETVGIEVVSPAALDRQLKVLFDEDDFETGTAEGGTNLAGFLKRDFHVLTMCEGIVFLEGWEDSTGANCELIVGQMAGMSTWLWIDGNLYPEPNLTADLELIFPHINKVVWGVADVG